MSLDSFTYFLILFLRTKNTTSHSGNSMGPRRLKSMFHHRSKPVSDVAVYHSVSASNMYAMLAPFLNVKNAQCRRVLYSKRKLGPRELQCLQELLEDTAFVCGVRLRDLDFPATLDGHSIEVADHMCRETVEVLYYSANVSDKICIYCSSLDITDPDWQFETATVYPTCDGCSNLEAIKIKGRKTRV
ncbi:uncharacterized protein [Amphiura filiformis]|uniref:uncharacterized protein n=1 Tax=Amphiura filiformis TaxID=82378 RepID=UPI003B2210E8